MPAYNAEKRHSSRHTMIYAKILLMKLSLWMIILRIKQKKWQEISGITTIVHDKNKGYGGNQKTCYTAALKTNADIVIMVHPDYQYTRGLFPQWLQCWLLMNMMPALHQDL